MAWIPLNLNPRGRQVGDCAVRAVAKATGESWERAYSAMAVEGLVMGDMPNGNAVFGAYLKRKGFKRRIIPDSCPDCYTVEDFCSDHPQGVFVVGTGTHVLTIIDGDYYDSWQSGNEIPIYYFESEDE